MAKAPRPGLCKTRLLPPLAARSGRRAQRRRSCATSPRMCASPRGRRRSPVISPTRRPAQRHCSTASGGGHRPAARRRRADAPPACTASADACCMPRKALFDDGARRRCVLNSDSPTLPTALLVQAATPLLDPARPCRAGPGRGRRLLSARHDARRTPICSPISPGAPTRSPTDPRTRTRRRRAGARRAAAWYDVDDADAAAPPARASCSRASACHYASPPRNARACMRAPRAAATRARRAMIRAADRWLYGHRRPAWSSLTRRRACHCIAARRTRLPAPTPCHAGCLVALIAVGRRPPTSPLWLR